MGWGTDSEGNLVYTPDGPSGGDTIRVGETKVMGDTWKQWDGKNWFDTGVPAAAPRESTKLGDTINVGGRVMQWDPATARYSIDVGSSSGPKDPPAPPAPRYPTAGIENARTYTVDPYTGKVTWGDAVPGSLNDEQKRANELTDIGGARTFTTGERLGNQTFTAGENAAGRTFQTGERVAGQDFTAGENQLGRQFTGEENALDRALNAGQFAATLSATQKRDKFAAEQDYQNRIRQYAQDKLTAAQAFASQVGAVDPAALEAFYAAGGGNIANALAGGASAVSDNAVLPAARSLRATREMLAPTRYGGFDDPYAAPPVPTAAAGGRPMTTQAAFSAPKPAPIVQRPPTPPQSGFSGNSSPEYEAALAAAPQAAGGGAGTITAGVREAYGAANPGMASQLAELAAFEKNPRYAFGTQGEPATGTFITGDSTDPGNPFAGGAKPEKITVKDPPGENNAEAEVEPLAPPTPPQMGTKPKLAELFSVIGALLSEEQMGAMEEAPRFAYGTNGYETITPTAEDQPYMDEVRGIRNNVQFPMLNPYDTKFNLNPYSQQQRFYAGRQTKYGIPVTDQQQEQQRYQLGGVGRGAYSLGV